jgi:AraC-like DNA-binding protein
MTGTPRVFAETPDRASGGPDLLSEMLKAVRLTGSVFLNARFTAPFGLVSSKIYDDRTPMARLRHVSLFHMVVSGACRLETAKGQRFEVGAGELMFLPFADDHKLWNGNPVAMIPADNVIRPGPVEGMWTAAYGGGGEETRMVCGFVESSEFLFSPIFRTLPEVSIMRTGDDKVGALIGSTVREIVSLVEAATPGTQGMLGRMMELLFVEILRRHIARLPGGSTGWFAALNDPIVGRALQLLHADPARRWTIDELAREVGSSRTVVGERFKSLLGRPPMEYATSWRIQLAAERLRVGHESIARIAAGSGYDSEPAFIRAFKRVTGVTPGSWRAGMTAPV